MTYAGEYTFDVNAVWQKTLGPFITTGSGNYLGVVLNVLIPEGIMLLLRRRGS
jgi:hypothetical protein